MIETMPVDAAEIIPPRARAEVIPFGKYKGQPVDALAQDREYTEWLMGQSWFRERYGNVYTLIVNNFQEASETPEHNTLQALFVDNMRCAWFIEKVFPGKVQSIIDELMAISVSDINRYEANIVEKTVNIEEYKKNKYWEDRVRRCEEDIEFISRKIISARSYKTKVTIFSEFEVGGADVVIKTQFDGMDYYNHSALLEARIEIKPSVSDDYPAVLRQMKANKCRFLLTEQYTGKGATQEQFVKIFKASGLNVVFWQEGEFKCA